MNKINQSKLRKLISKIFRQRASEKRGKQRIQATWMKTSLGESMKLLSQFVPTFEIYLDKAGKYRWSFLHRGDIIARSPGSYRTEGECRKDIRASQHWLPGASIRYRRHITE